LLYALPTFPYIATFGAYTAAYTATPVPKLQKRLSDSVARTLPPPPDAYEIHWCKDTPGFGVRVTPAGAKAWIMERRVQGKTLRRSLGKAAGRGAVSAEAARKLMVVRNGELERGKDELVDRRQQASLQKRDVTLEVAVREYVEAKRRAKDGLPLKSRTKADYLAMVVGGLTTSTGRPRVNGELYAIASRQLSRIEGDDVRRLYAQLLKRGQRRATYAMQLLRAVLKWHGVNVPSDPLGKEVAGRDRIVLPATTGKPNPIPVECLGAWWRAACEAGRNGNRGDAQSADYLRFILLTGVRAGESAGNEHVHGITVGDVDLVGGRIQLRDTKNRKDHVLHLSKQALTIVAEHALGKVATEKLFTTKDPGKTLDLICAAAGVDHRSLHEVRKTFASVAEDLVSSYTLKKMINHSDASDVTGSHYVGKSETQLRKGWQMVADYIGELAATK